jgi:hypothetical protein
MLLALLEGHVQGLAYSAYRSAVGCLNVIMLTCHKE